MYKIETYVPAEALDNVRNAIKEYCCAVSEKYTHCMSWRKVQSMWMPINDANPYLGELDKEQFAEEFELVFRCKDENIDKVIKLIKENHPYEEVCIDVHKLDKYYY